MGSDGAQGTPPKVEGTVFLRSTVDLSDLGTHVYLHITKVIICLNLPVDSHTHTHTHHLTSTSSMKTSRNCTF